jgi:hypothetical protein
MKVSDAKIWVRFSPELKARLTEIKSRAEDAMGCSLSQQQVINMAMLEGLLVLETKLHNWEKELLPPEDDG